MENDVSDDDSNFPSYDELLDLVHEHQRAIKKQSKKYEDLNSLNATLATNYDNLLPKFQLLGKKHEELNLKIESFTKINGSLEIKQSTPSTNPISNVDASTSCIDLIDEPCSNPCNEKCHEDVFV